MLEPNRCFRPIGMSQVVALVSRSRETSCESSFSILIRHWPGGRLEDDLRRVTTQGRGRLGSVDGAGPSERREGRPKLAALLKLRLKGVVVGVSILVNGVDPLPLRIAAVR